MNSLQGRTVFLSASFPSGDRAQEVPPFDPSAIADAVTAVVRAVLLSDGKVVFGGHPTITPLVLMIGTELGIDHVVDVYQSEWFRDQITDETLRLIGSGVRDMHWTPRKVSLDASLAEMRTQMFTTMPIAGAVFVGGMSGIQKEFEHFGEMQVGVPRIPVYGPGGAAATLPSDPQSVPPTLSSHLGSRHYPFLASLIVDVLSSW